MEASGDLHLSLRLANLYLPMLCGKKFSCVLAMGKRKRNILRVGPWLINHSVNFIKSCASKSPYFSVIAIFARLQLLISLSESVKAVFSGLQFLCLLSGAATPKHLNFLRIFSVILAAMRNIGYKLATDPLVRSEY